MIFKGKWRFRGLKSSNFSGLAGQRLTAGAAEASHGRRGQDFTVPHKSDSLYGEPPPLLYVSCRCKPYGCKRLCVLRHVLETRAVAVHKGEYRDRNFGGFFDILCHPHVLKLTVLKRALGQYGLLNSTECCRALFERLDSHSTKDSCV